MMSRYLLLLLLFWQAAAGAADESGTLLIYQVTEPGVEPYTSRIMVTRQHLRMDDGVADGNFVLFERKAKIVYSVSRGDGTVLELRSRPVTVESPLKLEMRADVVARDEEMPTVAGKLPRHHLLSVNGEACYNVVAVEGLLSDAMAALRDFRAVLAGENARILPQVPADMHDPCDLALNTYAPGWSLDFGLPIQEWDSQGKGQILMDFREGYAVSRDLLLLPKGYKRYTTDSTP